MDLSRKRAATGGLFIYSRTDDDDDAGGGGDGDGDGGGGDDDDGDGGDDDDELVVYWRMLIMCENLIYDNLRLIHGL